MPEARALGSNTTGYTGDVNVSKTKSGLYQPREYKSTLKFDPIKKPYSSQTYPFKDVKLYDPKIKDPFKQKVYTYDKVLEYDHYYTYGLPNETKPKPKKKRVKDPTPAPVVKEEQDETELFPKGYWRSTVGMVKRTLKLSRDNKVNPDFTPLPGW